MRRYSRANSVNQVRGGCSVLSVQAVDLCILARFFNSDNVSFRRIFANRSYLANDPAKICSVFDADRHFFSVKDGDSVGAFRATVRRLFDRPFRAEDMQIVRAGVEDGSRRSNYLDRVQAGRAYYPCSHRLFIYRYFRVMLFFGSVFSVGAFPTAVGFTYGLCFSFCLREWGVSVPLMRRWFLSPVDGDCGLDPS